tara:strand:+ start:10157 stop:10945 length:789 start_codon:yes stop_codon:yes gene_type:complete
MKSEKSRGYFEITNLLDIKIIEKLNKDISEAYEIESKKANFGGTISGHLNCIPGSSARKLIKNIQEQTSLFEKISEFFSIDLEEYNVSIGANINLPGSHFQHMHMDSNFYEQLYILNIPLVDTNRDNGSISIVPDSHSEPYSYIQYLLKKLYKKRLRLNLKVGSCVVRTSNLWHRGTPNKTSSIRPMINIVFSKNKNDDIKDYLLSNLENHPDLIGDIKFANNWYKTTFLGRIWEILTVKFPLIHSTKRIIMSLIRPVGTST